MKKNKINKHKNKNSNDKQHAVDGWNTRALLFEGKKTRRNKYYKSNHHPKRQINAK